MVWYYGVYNIMHGHFKPQGEPLSFLQEIWVYFSLHMCKTIIMLVQVVGIVIISEVSMTTIYIRVWLHPRTIKILIHKNIQKFTILYRIL